MRLPRIFKQRRMRGKSKSPEAKFREKKAQVDSFLLDSWLRQLRQDPALAERIAEQRYGSEASMPHYGEGGDYESPDLLEILKTAREAKDLLRDEISDKGSTIRDIAEILKVLPQALQSLSQINPAQLQQFSQQAALTQPKFQQITQPPKQEQSEVKQPDFGSVNLEKLMVLLELEPEQAWQELQNQGDTGWINYLKSTSYEQLAQTLNEVAAATPEYKGHIEGFLKQYHSWLQNLITIAHRDKAK